MREQLIGDLARLAGEHAEHLRRQSGLVENVRQQQRAERRLLRRLQHHAVVAGDTRRDLVRHLVERMVERGDGADHPEQRLAQRVDLALLAVCREVTGKDLTVVLERGVAGELEDIARAPHLVGRVLLAQPALGGDQVGNLRRARPQHFGRAVADTVAVVARETRAEGPGGSDGAAHVGHRSAGDGSDEAAGIGIEHFADALGGDTRAGDAQRLAPYRGRRSAAAGGASRHGSTPSRTHRSCASGAPHRAARCGDS